MEELQFTDEHFELTKEIPERTGKDAEFDNAFDFAKKFGPFGKIPLIIFTVTIAACSIVGNIITVEGTEMNLEKFIQLLVADVIIYFVMLITFYVICLVIALFYVKFKK